MLRANKIFSKGLFLMALIVVLVIISIIYFPIYRNITIDNYTSQSDTLFYTGKNISNNSVMYLLMEYKILNKNSVYVKRSTVTKEGVIDFYHYFMIKSNDSMVLVKPVHDDEQYADSVYLDLRQEKIGRVDYPLNRLASELQFVGYERYNGKNGKQDSLIMMYGCDINESGCFEEHKNYWYFDKSFHLRKAVAENGIVFFIDKYYFGIE